MDTVKEDLIGKESLRLLEKADKYVRLSTMEISQHLTGHVLELGSGTGNLTQHLAFEHSITALDLQPSYLSSLKDKILQLEAAKQTKSKPFKTIQANLMEKPQTQLINQFDTLLSCQVLEHLPDDHSVIRNYLSCLKPGGKVVLQLPAHSFAFNDLDKNLGHYRRYNRKTAEALLTHAGLKIEKSYYFNFFGLLGWFWTGNIMKKQILPETELTLFNFIAPFVLKLDLLFSKICGLNVIVVAKKPA